MAALDPRLLHDSDLPWQVRVEAEVTSTSDVVKQAALAGAAPGLVLFAESQTAGRGRRENRWITPPGQDLMLTFLLAPEAPPALWPRVTTLAALALCRAIEDELPLQPRIKWPNDIYLHDRKAAGLLAEVVSTPAGLRLALGIGLNVNTCEFPPELAGSATSLRAALSGSSPRPLDRHPIARALLRHMHHQLGYVSDDFSIALGQVRERSWLMGRQIRATVEGREIYGRALDLTAEGHLLLALPDGSTTVLTSAESVRQVV
jgi:BirA family biotin operon repressor/biotin-[acetyl-CoA-carboxylase] ligase